MSASPESVAADLWVVQGNPGHCNVYFLRSDARAGDDDGDAGAGRDDGDTVAGRDTVAGPDRGAGRGTDAGRDRGAGRGVVMFDAGGKMMLGAVRRAASALGGLEGIVLGHGHTDHRGTAPGLGVPVRCHPDAVAEAQGRGGWEYWEKGLGFLPLAIRPAHLALHRFAWDGGPVRIEGTVTAGEQIAAGFEVVELPGHAPGQIALWRPSDRVALTTDVFYVVDMWGRPGAPALPVEGYSQDPAQARRSLLALADLEPLVCFPGHGAPVREHPERGTVAQQLRAAAAG